MYVTHRFFDGPLANYVHTVVLVETPSGEIGACPPQSIAQCKSPNLVTALSRSFRTVGVPAPWLKWLINDPSSFTVDTCNCPATL
jgi:hypothetical protein